MAPDESAECYRRCLEYTMPAPKTLNIGLSDCLDYAWVATSLMRHRATSPDILIRLHECPLPDLHYGLVHGELHLGLCQSDLAPSGCIATLVSAAPLALALGSRHPLLAFVAVPTTEIQRHQLIVLEDAGYRTQIERMLRPTSVTTVRSFDVLMALVAAGYGVGLAPRARLRDYRGSEVVAREVSDKMGNLNTYLLRSTASDEAWADQVVANFASTMTY